MTQIIISFDMCVSYVLPPLPHPHPHWTLLENVGVNDQMVK